MKPTTKRLILLAMCIAPLKAFVVEDSIDLDHIEYVSVCAIDRLDALIQATHATVWTQQEWEKHKSDSHYKPIEKIKGWGEPK